MCGITGLIDYQRDLRNEPGLIRRMTGTLKHRGPDDERTWCETHVLLGHRRLSVIDPPGGAQPMVAVDPDGRPVAVVVFCGEIHNYQDLRAQLGSLGYPFRTRSDTEVLLAAFLLWPRDFISRLEGMFAFAIWNIPAQEALLVRDHLGIKPLYYAETPGGLVFGSEPKAILESGLASRRVTAEGLCEIFDMTCTPGVTPYADIRAVKPGETVRVSTRGIVTQPWWTLEAREHSASLPDTIRATREILRDEVRRQTIADVPVCTFLSGGVDSSGITAIAAKALHPDPVRAFSVGFRGQPTGFRPDAVRGSDDTKYAADVAGHVGAVHETIMLDSSDLTNPEVRAAVLRATDWPPAFWGDMWPSLYLLARETRRQGCKVALSGELADELFGGYRWFRNPAALGAGTFPWLTSGSARYFGGSALLSKELLGKLNIPAYRAERYHEALAQVPVLPGESGEDKTWRRVTWLALTRFAAELLRRKDTMSMANGLEVRVPFGSRRLVEDAFNIPRQMHGFDGQEKSILRAAVADLLPENIAARRKNPYPATQDPSYERALRSTLAGLLEDTNAPVIDLLDADRARKAATRDVGDVSQPYDRGSVEMILWLDQWLREYGIVLDL